MKEIISSGEANTRIDEIIGLVKLSGGIEYAQQLAERYITKAERALKQLPPIKERETLYEIGHFIADRTY